MLAQFHATMKEAGASIHNPIEFIRELWQDYFINLIDYSLELVSPVPICDRLQMYSSSGVEKVPPELRAYLQDKSI